MPVPTYTSDYAEDGTVHNVIEDHDAQSDVIPGKLIMTGEVNLQPEQVVVFYDGEIGRNEAPIDAWEGGDLAGYVLFAQIQAVKTLADGTSEVPNDVMFEAIRSAHEENQKQIALINQMVAEIGKPKFDYPHADFIFNPL